MGLKQRIIGCMKLGAQQLPMLHYSLLIMISIYNQHVASQILLVLFAFKSLNLYTFISTFLVSAIQSFNAD